MVQTEKLDKGIALVNGAGVGGYARTLWEQQSERLRLEFPLSKPSEDQPGERLSWASGSIIQAVPSGEDQIRSFHPTLAIYDEATYLTGFGASWEAAESVCEQMIAISSVGPSTFWDIVRPGAEGVSHG